VINLAFENGWPCAASKKLGKFRGPGRKTDPCPYATLLMLKVLALYPEFHEEPFVKNGQNAIFKLWEQRKERKAYLFGMGRDSQKLKAPLIWDDILHLFDVFSHYKYSFNHPVFKEWLQIIESKRDDDGMFTPESIYLAWKEWDFGQKKAPSAHITFLIDRAMQRMKT